MIAGARLAAALLLTLTARAAAGDDLPGWDRTRWGMSSGEIAALYGSAAVRLNPPIEYAGTYADVALRRASFAGLDFIVSFQMDQKSRRLAQVLLTRLKQHATAGAWQATVSALAVAFGAPTANCDRRGVPAAGTPGLRERVWVLPTTTVDARYIAMTAAWPEESVQDDGGFARRILIRYAPTRAGTAACPGAR
jgi:hypothetical protein